jgi:hypothetical protein
MASPFLGEGEGPLPPPQTDWGPVIREGLASAKEIGLEIIRASRGALKRGDEPSEKSAKTLPASSDSKNHDPDNGEPPHGKEPPSQGASPGASAEPVSERETGSPATQSANGTHAPKNTAEKEATKSAPTSATKEASQGGAPEKKTQTAMARVTQTPSRWPAMLKRLVKLNELSTAFILSSPQAFAAWLKDLASTPAEAPA